jgi:hypothetical protein
MEESVTEIRGIKSILEDCKQKFQEQKISYKEKNSSRHFKVPAAVIHAVFWPK